MSKLTVVTTKPYPLWDSTNLVYLNTVPKEVTYSAWLESQINAGLVKVIETETVTEPQKANPTRSKAKTEG